MKLNELRDKDGATKARKRVGRGIGSGSGKTGGRGVKGQKSRSGVAVNGFEGGQMALYRRLPKRGFRNLFGTDFNIVSVARIQAAVDAKKLDPKETVTVDSLVKAGVVRRAKDGVRLLGDGDLKAKLTFEVAGASKSAIEKVEKAGGNVNLPQKAAAEKRATDPVVNGGRLHTGRAGPISRTGVPRAPACRGACAT
jgi:large subunit ribosomal protein L15